MIREYRLIGRVAVVALVGLTMAACSSKSNSANIGISGSTTAPTASGSTTTVATADPLAVAIAATAAAEKGTNRDVDPMPRPAVKGKHIVVISQGQANISSQIPSDGAVAAAKALGWQVDLYDGKLSSANSAPLVRQAIAAGADGIILDAIDCQQIQQPLQEAKAKGILVVGIYAFDCNDAKGGGSSEGLFGGQINFGSRATDVDAFTESYGADQANYIIAATHNTAKIIAINDPEFVVLDWTLAGFQKTIEASGGSKIVDTLNVTASDILSGQIVGKIQAEILRHPEANWIKSPYTFITTIGLVPALGAKAGQINVMGGEGFQPELDLLRQNKIQAVNIISSEWTGWAAVDTLNSLFAKQKPADSGIGWTIADKDHNLPASGNFLPPIDFKSEYKKAWGVS